MTLRYFIYANGMSKNDDSFELYSFNTFNGFYCVSILQNYHCWVHTQGGELMSDTLRTCQYLRFYLFVFHLSITVISYT